LGELGVQIVIFLTVYKSVWLYKSLLKKRQPLQGQVVWNFHSSRAL